MDAGSPFKGRTQGEALNYYRRFMGDYANKTADLSLAEHGAYTVLLDISYSTEAGLPGGYEALFRLCRAMSKAEQDAVRLVADRFFPLCEDGLRRNPRAADEIAKAQAIIDKQRKSGADSAHKRWSTDRSTHESTDGSTYKSTDSEAIQPPTTNLQPPTANHQPPKKREAPPRGSRLLLDALPGEWKDYCIAERVDLDPDRVFADFSDYWKAKPGKDGVKLDWLATWRKWVRNSREGKPATQSLSAFMDERDKRAAI